MKAKLLIKLGWFAFCCLLSLGQLEKLPFLPLRNLFFHDLVLIATAVLVFALPGYIAWLSSWLKKVKPVVLLFLGWLAMALVLGVLRGEQVQQTLLYLGRLALYVSAGIHLSFLIYKKYLSPKDVTRGLLLFTGLVLYFGLIQYVFVPDTRWLFFLGWDDHYFRLISSFLDPGFTGLILALGLLFGISRYSEKFLPAGLLLLIGVLLTYSRASYLALGIGLLLLALRKERKLGVLLLSIFLIAIPFLPRPGGEGVKLERTSTVVARSESFQGTFKDFSLQDWAIGKGTLTVPSSTLSQYSQLPSHAQLPDSWIASLISLGGVIGLGVFSLMIALRLKADWRTQPHFSIAIVMVLVHGLFNASLFYPFVVLFMSLWGALLYSGTTQKN